MFPVTQKKVSGLAENQHISEMLSIYASVNASLIASANASLMAGNIASVNASVQPTQTLGERRKTPRACDGIAKMTVPQKCS